MILSFSIECNSLTEFLDHWSTKYRDPKFRDRDKYDPYVGRLPLTEEGRRHLFEWKNGTTLSRPKTRSVEQNYPLSFPKNQLAKRYLDPQANGGSIWNIFYMHCIDPQTWPIFDQHTYRAMHFMKAGVIREISADKANVYESYEREYIPYVKALASHRRKIDKALYAFGQFLKIASAYR
jgi:hypothetical protein